MHDAGTPHKPTQGLQSGAFQRVNRAVHLPVLRRVFVAASVLVALWLGWKLAHFEFFLPGLMIAAVIPIVASCVTRLPADAIFGGLLLAGYLIGNRGFAQLSIPGVPLLPGEVVLGLGLCLVAWRAATTKAWPVHRDALNVTVIVWIILCSIRLPFDVRAHGILAIRDYALVYYALFFFLAQRWAAEPGARTFVGVCLTFGFGIGAPIALLFYAMPEAFLKLNVAGVPLIFVKSDVAGALTSAGVFWFAARHAQTGARWYPVCAAICLATVLLTNSRAAVVALMLGAVASVFLHHRRITRMFLTLAAVGALALAIEAALPREPGHYSRAFRLYESVLTVLDFSGTRVPLSTELGDKPDNNQFRLVWWRAVVDETLAEAPVLGLGFGRDIAENFVRSYYGDYQEQFSARSPHNFLLTIFARTGWLGLICFLALIGAMAVRTWKAARRLETSEEGAVWLAPWMILVAACFGVVLEGPMGAVVFWSLLGLANASTVEVTAPSTDLSAANRAEAAPPSSTATPVPLLPTHGSANPLRTRSTP